MCDYFYCTELQIQTRHIRTSQTEQKEKKNLRLVHRFLIYIMNVRSCHEPA